MMGSLLKRKDGSSISLERKEMGSKILCVVFSGRGYSYKNPLLYYAKSLCLTYGCDYIGFDYRYSENEMFQSISDNQKMEYFEKDNALTVSTIQEKIKSENYHQIILIGKSHGTSVIRRCLKHDEIRKKSILVLISPGSEWKDFISELLNLENPMLLVGSKEDKKYAVVNLEEIYRKDNLYLCEFNKGNHSLEVKNVFEDIEILKKVMAKLDSFLKRVIV